MVGFLDSPDCPASGGPNQADDPSDPWGSGQRGQPHYSPVDHWWITFGIGRTLIAHTGAEARSRTADRTRKTRDVSGGSPASTRRSWARFALAQIRCRAAPAGSSGPTA
jgi:hypothetical protein